MTALQWRTDGCFLSASGTSWAVHWAAAQHGAATSVSVVIVYVSVLFSLRVTQAQ